MFLSTDRQSGIEKIKIIFYGEEQIFPYILTIKAVVRKIEIDRKYFLDGRFLLFSEFPIAGTTFLGTFWLLVSVNVRSSAL